MLVNGDQLVVSWEYYGWLVVWNRGILWLSIQLGMSWSQLINIFQRGRLEPPTSHNIFHEKSMLMSNPNAKIWPVYFSMFPTSRMPRSWNTPTMWSTSRSASHQRFRRCLDCHRLRTGVGWDSTFWNLGTIGKVKNRGEFLGKSWDVWQCDTELQSSFIRCVQSHLQSWDVNFKLRTTMAILSRKPFCSPYPIPSKPMT